MNTFMAAAIGRMHKSAMLSREVGYNPSHSVWSYFNPRYTFRSLQWYLPFHTRIKLEYSNSSMTYTEE